MNTPTKPAAVLALDRGGIGAERIGGGWLLTCLELFTAGNCMRPRTCCHHRLRRPWQEAKQYISHVPHPTSSQYASQYGDNTAWVGGLRLALQHSGGQHG